MILLRRFTNGLLIAASISFATAKGQTIAAPTTFQVTAAPAQSTPVQLSAAQQAAASRVTSQEMAQYDSVAQQIRASLKSKIAAQQGSAPLLLDWKPLLHGGTAEAAAKTTQAASNSQILKSLSTYTFSFTGSGLGLTTRPASILRPNAIAPINSGASANTSSVSPNVTICPAWGCGGCRTCVNIADNDRDGLPDIFEAQVADNFTPLYGVSAAEQQQFARFGDYVPLTVTSLGGTSPISHYRVQPLGIATDGNNNQVFALRIDYLSLWNADGGLVGGGGTCAYSFVGLDQVVQQVSSHDLDVERSVLLVAAPLSNGGYNPDPNAYSLYAAYFAAHEQTFFDQSMYASFSPAVPSGNHVNLALRCRSTAHTTSIRTIFQSLQLGSLRPITLLLRAHGPRA